MEATVEQLPEDRVRLSVSVSQHDLEHAVEHAASDLATSVKIPGFRKGKVPMPVLIARVGKERLMDEAVSSHIGGWFRNAAATARIQPIAQPEYEYDVPDSAETPFEFTATVAVQPKIDVPDWSTLEVGKHEPEVPQELVDAEIEALRSSVAEVVPAGDRPAREGDVVVIDVVNPDGEARRDVVVELGASRLVEELETTIVGMSPGETKDIEHELVDGTTAQIAVALKEVKEKVLPPVDDDLAKAATEFDTLAELRADIEGKLRAQIDEEIESVFRAAAIDALVEAANVQPSARSRGCARERAPGRAAPLAREPRRLARDVPRALEPVARGLRDRLRAEAALSVARELVLESVAEQLAIEVSDEQIETRAPRAGRDATRRSRASSDSRAPRVDPPGPAPALRARPHRRRGQADPGRARGRAREALDAREGEAAPRDNVMDPRR